MNTVKKLAKACLAKLGYTLIKGRVDLGAYPVDYDESDKLIIDKCQPFTMTSREKIHGLLQAVKYLVKYDISGDIVECGVWRGGSMMAAMEQFKKLKDKDRKVYMYDTFEGMSAPTADDISFNGVDAKSYFEKHEKTNTDLIWAYSPIDIVRQNLYSIGLKRENLTFVQGKVEDTIPGTLPDRIALLRLDTDWYESTRHELIHLFPRLVRGGVLIIDDYGHWEGAKKAVDEYMSQNGIQIFLTRMDYSGRLAIKQ